MKKLSVKKDAKCMACLECVQACSNAFYKTFAFDKSCIAIVGDLDSAKPKVCIQCGKCARNCPQNAITQNAKGVYMINKKLCVGCGKCVEVCPFHVCRLPEGAEAATKCIACGLCAKACPMELLEIVES